MVLLWFFGLDVSITHAKLFRKRRTQTQVQHNYSGTLLSPVKPKKPNAIPSIRGWFLSDSGEIGSWWRIGLAIDHSRPFVANHPVLVGQWWPIPNLKNPSPHKTAVMAPEPRSCHLPRASTIARPRETSQT